jgi:hypothetical protein
MENVRVYEAGEDHPVSVGDWLITLILASIPLLGFILVLVWAFGGGVPRSKANWAKAAVILQLIGVFLMLLFWTSVFGYFTASGMLENF